MINNATRVEAHPGIAKLLNKRTPMIKVINAELKMVKIIAPIKHLTITASMLITTALKPCLISDVKFILERPASLRPRSIGVAASGNL